MAQLFGEIERRTLAQSIVEQVKELVLQGRLNPGQKLPSERELAEQLGVGRSSVREATSAMLAMGIIEIRPGEGAYVRPDFPQSMLDCVEWSALMLNQHSADLFEARIAIETVTARLATARATPADKEQLDRIVEQMASAATLDEFVDLDIEFHLALAKASQNLVLRDILYGLHNLMRSSMLRVLESVDRRELALEQHRSLCATIGQGPANEAEQIMKGHLRKDLFFFDTDASSPAIGD
jgi:GntR family transcriptional repressor for pyruvate dehydrogenase complex